MTLHSTVVINPILIGGEGVTRFTYFFSVQLTDYYFQHKF